MEENKHLVWWVVIVIIVLVIVAFALYYFRTAPSPYEAQEGVYTAPAVDSVSAVESDLKTTDLNNLDSELSDIDKALAK